MNKKRIQTRYGHFEVTVGCFILKQFHYKNGSQQDKAKTLSEAEKYKAIPITKGEWELIHSYRDKNKTAAKARSLTSHNFGGCGESPDHHWKGGDNTL